MKKKLFAIALTFISMNMLAQITVTDVNLVSVGDVIYQAYDTLPVNSISIGNTGANQTWDFSVLQVQEYDTMEFIDPVGTPFGSIHPSANLCIDDDGEYVYINKDAQGLSLVGFDNFPYPQLILPLPLIYGVNTTIGPITIMDSSMVNAFLPDSFAILITQGQAQTIDSIKIVVESSTEFNVDAFGNVIIPMGSFDALRVKMDDVTSSDYYVYCTDTLFFGVGSGWYPMPAVIFPSEVEITSSYSWWTNDPLIKFVLVQMDIDSLGVIDAVDFMHSPVPASVSNLSVDNINIYPIPATKTLTVETQNNELTILNLVDVNGKFILKKEFMQSINLDVSQIVKGIYYLTLSTSEGKLTKKIIVE